MSLSDIFHVPKSQKLAIYLFEFNPEKMASTEALCGQYLSDKDPASPGKPEAPRN
jgi:hypothetical protein